MTDIIIGTVRLVNVIFVTTRDWMEDWNTKTQTTELESTPNKRIFNAHQYGWSLQPANEWSGAASKWGDNQQCRSRPTRAQAGLADRAWVTRSRTGADEPGRPGNAEVRNQLGAGKGHGQTDWQNKLTAAKNTEGEDSSLAMERVQTGSI